MYYSALEMELPDYMSLYQVFFFVPFVATFGAAALIDRYGCKPIIYWMLLLVCIRNSTRALLFAPELPGWRHLRLFYWCLQRFFVQLVYSGYCCLPLKLAESWFPESERSLALSLFQVMPIVGVACAALVMPHFVVDIQSCRPLVWVNLACMALSVLAIFAGVRRSKPPEGPPSARSQANLDKWRERRDLAPSASSPGNPSSHKEKGTDAQQVRKSAATSIFVIRELLRVARKANLMVCVFALATFEQLPQAIFLVLQDILSGAGMSRVFTGQFLAGTALLASVIQLLVSSRLRRSGRKSSELSHTGTKRQYDPYNTHTCKILMGLNCATFMLFAGSLVLHELVVQSEWLLENQWWLIITTSMGYIIVRHCSMPYFNEQMAELICGSITEATTSAWQGAVGTILFNSLVFVFVHLRQVNVEVEGGTARPGYIRSAVFACGAALAATLAYLVLFDAASKRRRELSRRQQELNRTNFMQQQLQIPYQLQVDRGILTQL